MVITRKALLSLSGLLIAGDAFAMSSLEDDTLATVTGQDGIQIGLSASTVSATRFAWSDGDFTTGVVPTGLDLRVDSPTITPVTATINLDFGASNATATGLPALSIDATVQPFQFSTVGMRVANSGGSSNTFGVFAIDAPNAATFTFFNTNALFDGGNSLGSFSFNMNSANWYLAQPRCLYGGGCTGALGVGSGSFMGNGLLDGSNTNTQPGDYNILVFRNFTAKGTLTGKFTIDATKGFNFLGTLSMPRISATQGGFQTDIGILTGVDFSSAGTSTFNFANVNTATAAANNQGRHWRFGFSGDLLNVDVRLIGDNGSTVLNEATAGTSGLKLSPRFAFGKTTDTNEFVLEMGEPVGGTGCTPATAGCGSSVRFSNWLALDPAADPAGANRATYNMGDIYINLLTPTSGNGLKSWLTPASVTGATGHADGFSSFACASGTACTADVTSFGTMATSTAAGENSVAVAIRGFELQGGARTITLYNTDAGTALSTPQTWALMPTFYNLNANLLMYPSGHPSFNSMSAARHGTGFDLTVETTGKNTMPGNSSTKGTHLIVADTSANKYVGFRNIDARYSFLNSQLYVADSSMDFAASSSLGATGMDVNGLRFTSNMAFDIRAGLAVGNLPDGTAANQMKDNDDIVGIRWKFGGNFGFTFSPAPNGQSYIGLTSSLVATDSTKNGMYLVEPVDGTRIEWIGITGTLNLVSQNVIDADYSDASRIDIGKESTGSNPGNTQRPYVTFATAYQLAPGPTQADTDVIRIRQLNLYRPPATNAVFTGAGGTYNQGVDWKPGFALDGTAPGVGGNTTGTTYTLGEMVITGGRFYGEVKLKVQ